MVHPYADADVYEHADADVVRQSPTLALRILYSRISSD